MVTVVVLVLLAINSGFQVQAADFTRAKQIYVPSTRIPHSGAMDDATQLTDWGARIVRTGGVEKPSPAEVAKLRVHAEVLLRQGNLEPAHQLLQKCFIAQPQNHLIQSDMLKVDLDRAKKFERQRKFDQAIACVREAIYIAPSDCTAAGILVRELKHKGMDGSNANVRLKLARKLFAQGKLGESVVEYCQSYRLEPSAAACAGLGNVYLSTGKTLSAEQQYNLSLQIDPRYEPAYRQLGLLKASAGDVVGANRNLGKALEIDGNDAVASTELVNLWQQQVAQSPNVPSTHFGLARAYQLSGKLDSARAEYDNIAQLDPGNLNLPAALATLDCAAVRQQSNAAMAAAHTLETQGALEDAKGRISQALMNDPNNPELLLLQGELLEKLGRAGDAADAYRAVLYADPQNVEAARRLKSLNGGKPNFSACRERIIVGRLPSVAERSGTVRPVQYDETARLGGFIGQLRDFVLTGRRSGVSGRHIASSRDAGTSRTANGAAR